MFESVRHRLVGGAPLISRTVRCNLPEGRIAGRLARLQDAFPDLEIGSYPHMHQAGPSVRLVLRGTDAVRLAAAVAALTTLIAELGGSAEEIDVTAH
jgi:molybdopterin-biosynthesis enzyme MoeA-like protein